MSLETRHTTIFQVSKTCSNLRVSSLLALNYYPAAVLALPPPEMKISVEPLATVGSVRAINCSMSVVPHFITSPQLEIYGPDQLLLTSGNTSSSLTHTLDPVKSLSAGLYVCNGVLQIRSERKSENIYFDFQRFIHLSVQRKSLTTELLNSHVLSEGVSIY